MNPKFVEEHVFHQAKKPIRLGVANSQLMQGGSREANLLLNFTGVGLDGARKKQITLPVTCYDGEVICEVILSYPWLAENHVLLDPAGMGEGGATWVGALRCPKTSSMHVLQEAPMEVQPGLDTCPPATGRGHIGSHGEQDQSP